jgi:DedD protein
MEQPMKERLTGAAVLVILAVILIPLLLDGPEPPASTRERLTLPAQDAGRQVIEIRRGADKPAGAGGTVTASAPASAVRTEPERSPAPDPTPDPTPDPVAEPEPVVETPAPVAKAAPPPARTPPPAAAAPVTAGWVVQIGSFGRRDNAERLKRELEERGFPVVLMPVESNGRTLHRVRVGPYGERGEADSAARRLAAGGQTGRVVRHGG